MNKKFLLLLIAVVALFASHVNLAEAAATCSGQWPGPDMDVRAHLGGPGGAVIGSWGASDPSDSGFSFGGGTVSVPSGSVVYFEGEASAYEFNSPSTMSATGASNANFLEGPLRVNRSIQTGTLTSAGSFRWTIDVDWCGGPMDSSWRPGYGEISVNIDIDAPSMATVNVTSNISASWLVGGPDQFSGSGTYAIYTATPGTYNIVPSDESCYSWSVNQSPQSVSSGGSITFAITYTNTCGNPTPPPQPLPPSPPPQPPATCAGTNMNQGYCAKYISQSVPTTMTPGQTVPVSITMHNNGLANWYTTDPWGVYLGNIATTGWGVTHVDVPYDVFVCCGLHVANFNFNITAPPTPGVYEFKWQMGRGGYVGPFLYLFGDQTPRTMITVAYPTGTINVVSNNALGSWTINGPQVFSGSGAGTFPYTAYTGDYTITANPIPGYAVNVTPATTQSLTSGGNITYNLDYTILNGVVNVNANISAGNWNIKDSAGTVVASGSGTSPVAYNLSAGVYTLTAASVAGYTDPSPNPRTVTVTGGSNQNIVLNYVLPPLNAPTITGADNTTCGQIALTWTDNSSIEDGYRIYRRDASGGPTVLIKTLAPNVTSYTDPSSNVAGTNPIQNHSYYYVVEAYSNVPVVNRVSQSAEFGPVLNILCRPDLKLNKTVTQVLKSPFPPGTVFPYISSTTVLDTDVLRFQVVVSNIGNSPATVTGILDTLSNNLVAPPSGLSGITGCAAPSGAWHLCVDKDGDGIYNEAVTIFGSEVGSVAGSAPNLTFNAGGGWGIKDVSDVSHPNWIIKFDAQVRAVTSDPLEQVSNTTCANYTFSGTNYMSCGQFGPILIRTGDNRDPRFREVQP